MIFLYLCMTTGNIIEAATVSKSMGIARPTVSKYLKLLDLANLIYTGYPVDMVVPNSKILIEIKYRANPKLKETEAIVEWSKKEAFTASILVTKNAEDYGLLDHVPIMRIPAFAFLYLLGHAEKMKLIKTI